LHLRGSTAPPVANPAVTTPAGMEGQSDSSGAESQAAPPSAAPLPGSGNYPYPVPNLQTGLTPRKDAGKSSTTVQKGLTPRNPGLRPPLSPADAKAQAALESIADQATKSSGAVFQDSENVVVKPPLLTALITLEKHRSPYDLDADSSAKITLHDVLTTALLSNLDIKIANQDALAKRWDAVNAFSGFLPNIGNEINFQGLSGAYVTPAGFEIPIHNAFLTTNSGLTWTVFKGGAILHNFRESKHNYKASVAAAKGTLNDVLEQVTNDFYNLVLNEVMLQIRVKQVETTNALVLVNKDLYANGVNTQLDVLQAQYQLSMDRQQLIQQQVARRQAAVKLATSINLDPEVDLMPRDRLVSKIQLVDPRLSPNDLIKLAIDNRQELKRYEELRLAAKEQVKVTKAALLPVVSTQGTVIGSMSRATSLSSNSGTGLSSAGVGVGPASVTALPVSGESLGPKDWTMRSLFVLGVDVQWNLGGLGVQQVAQINTARADARKASLEFNRSLAQIYQEVRDAYLSSLAAENLIIETTDTVNYGTEELRVAEVRLKDGIGTSLDVINAERDYINALVAKANAIIQYDESQAKLLHAIGRLSVDTLTSTSPLRQ
jgi:outer membrane protein TolC